MQVVVQIVQDLGLEFDVFPFPLEVLAEEVDDFNGLWEGQNFSFDIFVYQYLYLLNQFRRNFPILHLKLEEKLFYLLQRRVVLELFVLDNIHANVINLIGVETHIWKALQYFGERTDLLVFQPRGPHGFVHVVKEIRVKLEGSVGVHNRISFCEEGKELSG